MSGRGFQSVFMAGAVATAALGCYLVSLRVASERAALESVETKIVLAQRDIRTLETEIGTRARLAQLERWNVRAIQLSAPTADQFVENGFQLATMVRPAPKPSLDAPIILAAAPIGEAARRAPTSDSAASAPPSIAPSSPGGMMHVASYSRPTSSRATPRVVEPAPGGTKPAAKPTKAGAAPATKSIKTATTDPLAPLSSAKPQAKASAVPNPTAKDNGTP